MTPSTDIARKVGSIFHPFLDQNILAAPPKADPQLHVAHGFPEGLVAKVRMAIAPKVAAWPKFRTAYGIAHLPTGDVVYLLNSDYFADDLTARVMAEKYGEVDQAKRGVYYKFPSGGSGGLYTVSELEYHIVVQPRLLPADSHVRFVNAGLLASYYRRNPQVEFPGLADKLIRAVLKSGV